MKRAELQKLAKQYGLKANRKNEEIIHDLMQLGVKLSMEDRVDTDHDNLETSENVDQHLSNDKHISPSQRETIVVDQSVYAYCKDDCQDDEGQTQTHSISTKKRSNVKTQHEANATKTRKEYPKFEAPSLEDYQKHRKQLESAGFTIIRSPSYSVTKPVILKSSVPSRLAESENRAENIENQITGPKPRVLELDGVANASLDVSEGYEDPSISDVNLKEMTNVKISKMKQSSKLKAPSRKLNTVGEKRHKSQCMELSSKLQKC